VGFSPTTFFVSGATINVTVATFFVAALDPCPTLQEGQEDQLGGLGLVVNMIVLWNTLYMGKAIEHLRATGVAVHEEDVKRLTPLWYEHIRLTGRYEFMLTAQPEVGGLRPLQQKRQ
jgi:hypothetical protein